MAYVANVVITDGSRINYDGTVKRCSDISDTNTSLPTLIVGYKNAERWIQGYDILKKWYPEQRLYWTFGSRERKCEYDVDIEEFYKIVIEGIIKDVRYEYLDIINLTIAEIKDFIRRVKHEGKKVAYVDRERFIHIYLPSEKTVYGISLDLCAYMGIGKEHVFKLLGTATGLEVVRDNHFLSKRLKYVSYANCHLIPVFYNYFHQGTNYQIYTKTS